MIFLIMMASNILILKLLLQLQKYPLSYFFLGFLSKLSKTIIPDAGFLYRLLFDLMIN